MLSGFYICIKYENTVIYLYAYYMKLIITHNYLAQCRNILDIMFL